VDYVVLLALLVQHQKFKVIACVENVVIVYDSLCGGALHVSFGYFEKRSGDDMVARKGADVTLNQADSGFLVTFNPC
jgi:hypothetical protein